MADRAENRKLIEQAQELTKEYVDLLKEWTSSRRASVKLIRETALKWEEVEHDANNSKVSAGLRAPIEAKSVQDVFDADNKLTKDIEDKKYVVDVKVLDLSNILHLAENEVFGALLMSLMPGENGSVNMDEFMVFQLLVSTVFVNMLHLSFQSGSIIGMGMGALAKVSQEGVSKVLGTVLKGVAAGAMPFLDIDVLVKNLIELSAGSPSGAAPSLREIAIQLEKQADDLEKSLKIIQEEGEKYGIATSILKYSSDAWKFAFQSLDLKLLNHASNIAKVVRNILTLIEKYEEDKTMLSHLNITIIAHGGIDPTVMYPAQIYYMTEAMESVCCYSPWGCSVDALVICGIVQNTINVHECTFTGPVIPEKPREFNILPKSMELTPNVLLRSVKHGEAAHEALKVIKDRTRQDTSDGLIIPFLSSGGTELLPFTEMPLWICTSAIEIAALVRRITVSVRIAACLSQIENVANVANPISFQRNGYYPDLKQYCKVQMNISPPIKMTREKKK